MKRRALGVAGMALAGAALCHGAPRALDRRVGVELTAQAPPVPAAPDPRVAGLQWGFVRVHPAADWNLSRRVRSATAIQVNDPIEIRLEDPDLFAHPWIYVVDVRTRQKRGTQP